VRGAGIGEQLITLIEPSRQRHDPYSFDAPAYQGCYELEYSAMDKRHVFIIHEILKSWPFASALEIGSFNGASSTAFIEAINSGKGLGEKGIATFCEVSIQDSLIEVVKNCRDLTRVRVTQQPSWAVLDSELYFDFILVDGSHDLDTVSIEVTKLIRRKPLCIMAHDTNATDAGWHKCEGAKWLRDVFEFEASYFTLEDREMREGERTQRGLFFATTNAELMQIAKRIYAERT
jgi:hypothetical protein